MIIATSEAPLEELMLDHEALGMMIFDDLPSSDEVSLLIGVRMTEFAHCFHKR